MPAEPARQPEPAPPSGPVDGTRAVWRDLAERDADALVSQLPEWLDVLCRTGYEDASRTYETTDGNRMLLPLVRRLGSLPRPLAPLASLPAAWGSGGLLAERRPTATDIAMVVADLRAQPAIRVTVRPNPLHSRQWAQAARGMPLVVASRRAHVLDLRGGSETVWNRRFTAEARRGVRKGETAGLGVDVGASPDLLGRFRQLYELSVRRSAELRHEPQALAMLRAYRLDPPAKFLHIAEALPQSLRVWVANDGDIPVAALIVLLGANASHARGAVDRRHPAARRAAELLHWYAIREAAEADCTSFHLGDTGRSQELTAFREGLGARAIDYAGYCFERVPLQRPQRAARAAVMRAVRYRDAG